MEPTRINSAAFWEGMAPVVFSSPRLRERGMRLEGLLAGQGWGEGGVVFASSGSSGEPKWVLHRRASLLASARMVNEHLRVGPDDYWLLALPEWHVGGCGVAARAYVAGCGFGVMEGRWEVGTFVEVVTASGATCVSLVPTQVHDLVSAGVTAPPSLRVVVVGGGALAQATGEAARGLGWPVLQSYGMTEAGSQVATASLDNLRERFAPDRLEVLSGWEVRVDEGGLLSIRGEALFGGFVEEGEDGVCLRETPAGAWFTTSDLVTLSDGRLSFGRRKDRTVKVRGELVEMDRLECDLSGLAGSDQDLRIVAVEDGRVGYRLVPVVEGAVAGWREWVEEFNGRLPGYARLESPVAVAEFPRTELGKVDLSALQQLLSAGGRLR